jgi:tryptophan-rich sensory protein
VLRYGCNRRTVHSDAWYEQLAKPDWTPLSGVFATAWTILYGMMAVGAWLVWKGKGFSRRRLPLRLFALQLAPNAAWSCLFFGLHRPGLALRGRIEPPSLRRAGVHPSGAG